MTHVLPPNGSVLVPDELRFKGEDIGQLIAPVVYAHFLRFLCYYHLYDYRQYRKSLQNLKLSIEEKHFIANSIQESKAYNMLGIAFHLIGDTKSAKQAFMQSLELNPNDLNDAFDKLLLIG